MLSTDIIHDFATRIVEAIQFGTPREALVVWREWRKRVAKSGPRHRVHIEFQARVRELMSEQRVAS